VNMPLANLSERAKERKIRYLGFFVFLLDLRETHKLTFDRRLDASHFESRKWSAPHESADMPPVHIHDLMVVADPGEHDIEEA
jgi:hypothetical protein